jgi:hypothetical protein
MVRPTKPGNEGNVLAILMAGKLRLMSPGVLACRTAVLVITVVSWDIVTTGNPYHTMALSIAVSMLIADKRDKDNF